MMGPCPSFELLCRFQDGVLDAREEAEVAEHLSQCSGCSASLRNLEPVDSLIHYAAAGASKRDRRRIRLVPLAAAAAMLAILGYVLTETRRGRGPGEEAVDEILSQASGPQVTAVLEDSVPRESATDRGAVEDRLLRTGDVITTPSGRRLKVALGETDLLVNERTSLSLTPSGVRMEGGEVYAIAGKPIDIETPEGTVRLEAGEFRVRSGDGVVLSAFKGKAVFRSGTDTVPVDAGHELRWSRKGRKPDLRRSTSEAPWADSMRDIVYKWNILGEKPSRSWRTERAGSATVVEAEGRRALSFLCSPGMRKGSAVNLSQPFPLSGSIEIEFGLRMPERAGVEIVLNTSGSSKESRSRLTWIWTAAEERFGKSPALRGASPLWRRASPPIDSEWHAMKIVFTTREAILYRDGALVTRVSHELPGVDRLVFGLGVPREVESSIEVQVSDLVVRRP